MSEMLMSLNVEPILVESKTLDTNIEKVSTLIYEVN